GDIIKHRADWITEYALTIWAAIGKTPVVTSYRGKSPKSLLIMGEYKNVSSWRDVLWKSALFAIEWEKDFKEFTDRLQSSYLTQGERARARQLPNGWWLYISLSADSVVDLCARIFEQLGLSDEDWEIEINEK
ncbi:MAG: hypothetical protein ACPG7F_15470, partial [Aggregatilineales bacterium]